MADRVILPMAPMAGKTRESLRATIRYRSLVDQGAVLSEEESDTKIRALIESGEPALVGRLGRTEFMFLLRNHLRRERSPLEKAYALVARLEPPFAARWQDRRLRDLSGFYPLSRQALGAFDRLYFDAMKELDLLGSWIPGETHFGDHFGQAEITTLGHLSPIGNQKPWTSALKGKRVLVVHPFAETISGQFEKRRLLFPDPDFLPDFSLTVVPAVQSLGGAHPDYPTWFDALDAMTEDCQRRDYDVALIACGAYGLPLGARLKRQGKVAIVLGGVLQLLFGIKGRRWDDSGLYNDHWVRPKPEEQPHHFKRVEDGAYW